MGVDFWLLGFRVLGFRVWGLGLGVQDVGYRFLVSGGALRVEELWGGTPQSSYNP